ncbi:hypothetical protein HK405_002462, partial [Cladochytrium tenue]
PIAAAVKGATTATRSSSSAAATTAVAQPAAVTSAWTTTSVPSTRSHLSPASAFAHLRVERVAAGDFGSALVTTRAFRAGDVVAPLAGVVAPVKSWSTVQVAEDLHVELAPESNLVYM